MHHKLLAIPAILLAALAISPAYATPATTLKEVTVGGERVVELTNNGQLTLKVVARTGYDHSSEAEPSDNGIVELFVEPGKSVVVKGPYNAYEYYPTPTHGTNTSYRIGG